MLSIAGGRESNGEKFPSALHDCPVSETWFVREMRLEIVMLLTSKKGVCVSCSLHSKRLQIVMFAIKMKTESLTRLEGRSAVSIWEGAWGHLQRKVNKLDNEMC